MRISGWLLMLGLATACGGTFSNDDLEFLNALPEREELRSKLPGTGAVSGASGPRALQTLGAPSALYADTRQASSNFNGGLDALLALLEGIRALPPTTRETDLRIWGPAPDREHPGHEVRFVMSREGAHFGYVFQERPVRAGEDAWWSVLEGSFQADGGLRQGEGTMRLFVSAVKAHGFDAGGLANLERLDIAYQTRALPLQVSMRFVPVASAGTGEIFYTYRELPGGLGEMAFLITRTDVLPGGKLEDMSIVSRWTGERGGVGRVTVTGGDVPAGYTAAQVECWDEHFLLTYLKRTWESGAVGMASACPDVSALGP